MTDTNYFRRYPGLTLAALAVIAFVIAVVRELIPDAPDSTPPRQLAWYEGGTLHSATVGEWKAATRHNKVATAADWWCSAFVGFGAARPEQIDVEGLRPYAEELADAVDAAAASAPDGARVSLLGAKAALDIMKRRRP
jgi:hypothetical protein